MVDTYMIVLNSSLFLYQYSYPEYRICVFTGFVSPLLTGVELLEDLFFLIYVDKVSQIPEWDMGGS
jgi:hypothetical protein